MKFFNFTIVVLLFLILLGCNQETIMQIESRLSEIEQNALKTEQEITKLNDSLRRMEQTLSSTTENPAITKLEFIPDGSWRDDPFLGPIDAPVVMMMFTDYQSPASRRFVSESLGLLKSEFFDTNKVRFVLRDFPLQTNPFAVQAASLAHCAGEQGAYWEIHDYLFREAKSLDAGDLSRLIMHAPVQDREKLSLCLESDRYRGEIMADVAEGERLGARGTPAFYLGRIQDSGAYEGSFIRGAQPVDLFRRELQILLGK